MLKRHCFIGLEIKFYDCFVVASRHRIVANHIVVLVEEVVHLESNAKRAAVEPERI